MLPGSSWLAAFFFYPLLALDAAWLQLAGCFCLFIRCLFQMLPGSSWLFCFCFVYPLLPAACFRCCLAPVGCQFLLFHPLLVSDAAWLQLAGPSLYPLLVSDAALLQLAGTFLFYSLLVLDAASLLLAGSCFIIPAACFRCCLAPVGWPFFDFTRCLL